MKSQPYIRNATLEDCATIATIYNQYVGTATMETNRTDAYYFQKMMEDFNDRERFYVMELKNEGIISWAKITRYSYKKGYSTACETAVFFDGKWLRKGYGTVFKKFVIEECKNLGYRHLVAKIFADNEASIEYNKKLGYEVVGIQRKIGFVNGHWQDVALMQLVLE